jgi:peptidoglycan/LPS O-acetylase OafA/YrhL
MVIVWITLFHCILAYGQGCPCEVTISSLPALLREGTIAFLPANLACAAGAMLAGLIQEGAQGVGVFILFSGFGLTYSLVKGGGPRGWTDWYKRRFLRLLPVYWFAHLLFAVSPFQYQHDPIDYRFLLSLLGDRIYPVDKMFYYLVPAWWFLGLLIELYLVFPLLYRLMQKLGALRYLALCIILASVCRYLLVWVFPVNGDYAMGAFFVCRLWEFAAGMVFGKLMAEEPQVVLEKLFSWKVFLGGVIVYALGRYTYQPNFLYSFSDGLTAMGLSVIMIHLASIIGRVPALDKALVTAGIYSYGIYLFHQPYIMYVGEKLRPFHFGVFLIASAAMVVLIAIASICIEYSMNRVVDRWFRA